MKLGEIRYRADSGIEVDLTLSTAETLGNVLTDMDLAVLTAKLRVISARVDRATESDGATLVTTDTMIMGARRNMAEQLDQDPFR